MPAIRLPLHLPAAPLGINKAATVRVSTALVGNDRECPGVRPCGRTVSKPLKGKLCVPSVKIYVVSPIFRDHLV